MTGRPLNLDIHDDPERQPDWLAKLYELNKVIAHVAEPLAGNLFYDHEQDDFESSPPVSEFRPKRDRFRAVSSHRHRLLEVGVNGGHSAYLALTENATLEFHGVDICEHAYVEPAITWLMQEFPHRVKFDKGDCLEVLPYLASQGLTFDIFHIDGAKQNYYDDIVNCSRMASSSGALLIVDDSEQLGVRVALSSLVRFRVIKRLSAFPPMSTTEPHRNEIYGVIPSSTRKLALLKFYSRGLSLARRSKMSVVARSQDSPQGPDDTAELTSGPYRRSAVFTRVMRNRTCAAFMLPPARVLRSQLNNGPRLGRFDARSQLVTAGSTITAARYPVVDVHAHLGRWLTRDGSWMTPDVDALLGVMDRCNVATLINLDGRWGDELKANLDRYDRAHPGRFLTFCHLNWTALETPTGQATLVRSLENSAELGARGLKVWKDLGLKVHIGGRRLLHDDPLLAPVWETAGALGLPVLVHVGDPLAFFDPVDHHNERLEEILRHRSISLAHLGRPAFSELMTSFETIVARYPQTTFIGAHAGCYAENLAWVSDMLDRYPNFWVDTASRSELGRQPRAAARLIERHSGRVLFGGDILPVEADTYGLFFRMLETEDEYFPYATSDPASQGRWSISGLGLESHLLERVYNGNARQLFGCET